MSNESVASLTRMNGFLLTFGQMLAINIIIRQVMINVIAIFMHNDYHHAVIHARENLKKQNEEFEARTEAQVKQRYNQALKEMVS